MDVAPKSGPEVFLETSEETQHASMIALGIHCSSLVSEGFTAPDGVTLLLESEPPVNWHLFGQVNGYSWIFYILFWLMI